LSPVFSETVWLFGEGLREDWDVVAWAETMPEFGECESNSLAVQDEETVCASVSESESIHRTYSVAELTECLISGHANLNLTPEEKRVFFQLFQAADKTKLGVVTGEIAVPFFEKTKLSPETLGVVRP
jgi:hypothetical protein